MDSPLASAGWAVAIAGPFVLWIILLWPDPEVARPPRVVPQCPERTIFVSSHEFIGGNYCVPGYRLTAAKCEPGFVPVIRQAFGGRDQFCVPGIRLPD